MSEQIGTYEQFVGALEDRPRGWSPLRWMASRHDRTDQWTHWVFRWLKENRSGDVQKRDTA